MAKQKLYRLFPILSLWKRPLTFQARYGFFASLAFWAAVLAFILCTLIFEHIPGRLDMTQARLYSLSIPTENLLKQIDQDISLTLVWQKEIEQQYNLSEMYAQVNNLLKQYAQKNRLITYRVVDPVVNPELVLSYTQGQSKLGQGSIIVAGTDLQRVISFETWAGFYGRKRVKLNVEGPVSNAILYIITGKMPKIYSLSAHGETDPTDLTQLIGQSFQDALIADNFAVQPLSLRTQSMPDDADVIMILSPQTEFSNAEIRQLEAYLENGGRLWVNLALTNSNLPRLHQLLRNYGLSAQGMAAERDAKKLLPNMQNNPLYFEVGINTFEGITQGLKESGSPLVMGQAMGLLPTGEIPAYIRLYPLLKTSDQAVLFGRTKDQSLVRLRENREIHLAYAITAQKNNKDLLKESRLLVTSGDLAVMSSFPASAQFYLQGVQWLADSSESLNIPSRNLVSLPLNISISDFVIFSFVFVIALPALLLVAGFAVWNKRRRM